METYIVEVIIASLALVGTLVGSMLANNKHQAVLGEQLKGVKDDINTLSSRVDKHNNLVERMVVVEQRSKSNSHRLDNLEQKGGE
ncbi:MAG: hypothetical protein IJH37_05330 [Clostridia bacterium]|nr:hypothetical protein [Clostridia bacterium]